MIYSKLTRVENRHNKKMYKFQTDYSSNIDRELSIKKRNGFKVIDLFAGCGGLGLGFEAAGFETVGYEMDKDCCKTYESNLNGKCYQVVLDKNTNFEHADVVIGGPPCQPFSVGGEQKGILDSRDGFPAFINAINKINPSVWMFENVRGVLYKNKWYFDQILMHLSNMGYHIEVNLIKVSDYGVAQNRERLIVVGHKNYFEFPKKKHQKVTAYEALGDYFFYEPDYGKYLTKSMDDYVKKYEIASKCINPRDLHMHKPSRTLTCRNLAGATGDMLRIALPSGKRRRLLIREAARLQSFPDWYKFIGNDSSVYKQIGNAVPPLFSYHLAKAVLMSLVADQELVIKNTTTRHPIQMSLL
jgi:DNA (cytosine-5)-methyltransferase 1